MRTNSPKEILNIKGVAEYLGISPATVRNWVKSGELSTHNKNCFYKSDIEKTKQKILSGQLKKLNQRANKKQARRAFIPKEHINNPLDFEQLSKIITFIQKNRIPTPTALFLLSLNLLKKENLLLYKTSPLIRGAMKRSRGVKNRRQEQQKALNQSFIIIQGKKYYSKNKQIQKEISSWFLEIKKRVKLTSSFAFLWDCSLPDERDILGIIYQSLLFEGKKSQKGSYYSPYEIVHNIQKDYVKEDSKVLDPCCGTGQFLLAFADTVKNPLNIYGMDYDPIAVKIARLNLLIKFKNQDFVPNIFYTNTLLDKALCQSDWNFPGPFWRGAGNRHSRTCQNSDKQEIFNVKRLGNLNRHSSESRDPNKPPDLSNKSSIKKSFPKSQATIIQNKNKQYKVQQIKWTSSHDFIFNIYSDPLDTKIIDKIYHNPHTTLKNRASWALGIVTGNNKKFIISKKQLLSKNKGELKPIYKKSSQDFAYKLGFEPIGLTP